MKNYLSGLILVGLATSMFGGESLPILPEYFSVRNAEPREWSNFPLVAEKSELSLEFAAPQPEKWKSLTLRQAETKQLWELTINGKKIGDLVRDHNDLESAYDIPVGLLQETGNQLRIFTKSPIPDDVQLGQIELHDCPISTLTDGIPLKATVVDESGQPLPCRFTIVEAKSKTLALTSETSNDQQAVRTGVIYSLNGTLSAKVRAGRDYEIFVGRGFEYEILKYDAQSLAATVSPIILKKQVDTSGLISCDTHLHTLEHARHGDCSVVERLISIAGEGIELAISTEHDKHIDYLPTARRLGADRYFTSVVGCEVTTHEGHFNSFPVAPELKPAEHLLRPWPEIFRNIFKTGAKVCIINHPRDIHRNFRPLDPVRWDVASGTFTDGRKLEANGFELINSGATQSDPMELTHDWMALLRSGHRIAAVGASDSHTVNFAIPGQARTYLAVNDADPATINVDAAVTEFLEGRTHVSFGLLAQLKIENDDLIATVSGPDWTRATQLSLFENGTEIDSITIPGPEGCKAGLKSTLRKKIAPARPGTFYVAVARGPGITEPWWMMMPPYQPASPENNPYVFAVSSAVFPGGR